MPESKTTISVIIKTYDDRAVRTDDAAMPPLRDVLVDTLQSLCEQTVLPTEVIIVDSSASDGIRDVLNMFRASSIVGLPYTLIHQPLAPIEFTYTHALNVGIATASSDILVSLSGDATPANSNWLRELIYPLSNEKVAGVYSRHVARPDMSISSAERLRLWWRYRSRKTETREQDHVFSNASSAFRSELILQYPFDETLKELEDYAWAKDVQQAGYNIVYAGKSMVYHSHDRKTWPTLKRMLYYYWLRIKTDVK